MATSIEVYGTDWCRLTYGIREYLTNSRVDYDYFDIERDPRAAEYVRAINDGRQRYPVVVFESHAVTNPTLAELGRLLRDATISEEAERASPYPEDVEPREADDQVDAAQELPNTRQPESRHPHRAIDVRTSSGETEAPIPTARGCATSLTSEHVARPIPDSGPNCQRLSWRGGCLRLCRRLG